MLVLGIETSCDETAAAVLQDGSRLLSNVIFSQDEVHSKLGGIVPELAGRCHVDRIHRVVGQALTEAGVGIADIDLIGVTRGPGLVVSLLVGLNTAKGLAYAAGKPVIGINHLEGHLLAIFLQEQVEFPYLALIVSGGHTDLCRVEGVGRYRILGRTRDDAAGESFDKVAKMLGLGYPGGPVIERLSKEGRPDAVAFPRGMLDKDTFDFSFSGLKTAVRRFLAERNQNLNKVLTDADIAASFQEAVVDILAIRLHQAARLHGLQRWVVTGGVAANQRLGERVRAQAAGQGFQVYIPDPVFCTDNAAMIACAAYHRHRMEPLPEDWMHMDAQANLPL
ncbi:MAG: tRNA (adenosine(37)-N6)-threonylcarbamoyltransferase complex transferase subunit TsaD [Nitrospinaceae bacterium]